MSTITVITKAAMKRRAITQAARTWLATEPGDDEADIAFEPVLHANNVLHLTDVIEEMWSDAPETIMLRLSSGTLIEIDVDSGNFLRGAAE